MPRHFRSRRSAMPRTVVQSFKKVLNFAGSSHAASALIQRQLVIGTDSVAAGQTGPTDAQVPTGSVIKYIEIMYSGANLINIALFWHMSIQLLRGNQTQINPLLVGGNIQRNQVFHQDMSSIGQTQIFNRRYRFKIPRRYQRVREGDQWIFNHVGDQILTDVVQVIYKFFR